MVPDGEGWSQDELLDDQALIVSTSGGLVVVVGFAHSGVMNTIEHARLITGQERVRAVIGGVHLLSAPDDQVGQTLRALKGLGLERMGVSHCTGLKVAARLARELGDPLFFNNVGTVTEFE